MSAEKHIPRVGLIGISGYGRVYLQLALDYQQRGELRLVAAVVINPREEAATVAELRAAGCEIFSDYSTMLERRGGALDLCLVPTGIAWHARMTLAALAAGANVLVEKPLACSTAEVRAIEEGAARARRFVAVGFQAFYEPAAAWLKQRLLDGAIGPLQSVRFLGQWPRPRAYFKRNDWAGRLEVDGVPVLDSPLSNAFAHFVNLSLYFACPQADDAARVELESAELFRAHAIESFDTAVVRLRTTEDVALWFAATHACSAVREPEIVITGDRGVAVWRHEEEAGVFARGEEPQRRPVATELAARCAMMTAVLRRLRDPAAPVCGPRIAGRHTALIEEIARAGEIVPVPPAMIEWESSDGGSPAMATPVIKGLEAALARAHESGSTLSDVGFRIQTPAAQSRSGR